MLSELLDELLEDSPFLRQLHQEALAEGERLGEAKGEARGEARGEAKGKVEEAKAILLRQGSRRFGSPQKSGDYTREGPIRKADAALYWVGLSERSEFKL